jgi:hypothetical protein
MLPVVLAVAAFVAFFFVAVPFLFVKVARSITRSATILL